MLENLPSSSRIRLSTQNGQHVLSVPYDGHGAMKFFIGLFLAAWLCMWAFSLSFALPIALSGDGGGFMIIWVIAWTAGGGWAAFFLYRLLKGTVPQTLVLDKPHLRIDTGTPPIKLGRSNQSLKNLFPKRKHLKLTGDQTKSITLRRTDSGNRLTIDHGADRIDLAVGATEIEREWLYNFLKKEYALD